MEASLTRRSLLLHLLGLGSASAGVALSGLMPIAPLRASPMPGRRSEALPFQPLRGPIPLPSDGLSAADQQHAYARVALQDQLLLPEGYRSEVLVQWGIRSATAASASTTTTWPCWSRAIGPC